MSLPLPSLIVILFSSFLKQNKLTIEKRKKKLRTRHISFDILKSGIEGTEDSHDSS